MFILLKKGFLTCGEEYTDIYKKWCITTNCSNYIQQMQLNIDDPSDILFEWIPYNQFNDIKEIRK
ncbi:hypothetical protein RhiirA5_436395 [Rhizophagus irregularis]|uniref:Uncharacterized protein n=1 Tax=Rhizophagus irregularis TaxID=588596 RepID=A0A2N0NLZ8_9GLOM|nr:hypothetical protein RhiirA5_436395 [Rhizophagus irregularis]GET63876.1 kinase-like domain-containing protein [Rhizophagus irregularis DAOM 181602=DAOM 197198]